MYKLSIVVPTKDRPEQLSMLLTSLATQKAEDFEVVVSDNSIIETQEDLVASFKRSNFRYVRPTSHLAMCDHWEFAVNHARGEYVSILIDKYMLFPFAVSEILNCLSRNSSLDILSWLYEGVHPENPSNFKNMRDHKVSYKPEYEDGKLLEFNPKNEMERRRSNSSYHRSEHGPLYFRGKICSGAYSLNLLKEIRLQYGRVFPPFAPDFTSCTLGLSLAKKCIDMNRVLGQFGGYDGNGAATSSDINSLNLFLRENDAHQNIDLLPIPKLYASVDNWVALDLYANRLVGTPPSFENLGWSNLFRHIRISIMSMKFSSHQEKESQLELLNKAEKQYKKTAQLKWGIKPLSCDLACRNGLKKTSVLNLIKKLIKKLPFAMPVYLYLNKRLSRSVVWANRMEVFHIASEFHSGENSWSQFIKKCKK